MGREWQSGDVAMVRVRKTWYRALRDRVGWVVATDDAHSDHLETCEGVNYECRPLVVIDPEDREQVERLWREQQTAIGLIREASPQQVGVSLIDALHIGLRRMSEPEYLPKPEEPTGLGAVVEDAAGNRWVRASRTSTVNHWRCADESGMGRKPYAKVDAVRVLSEGVTP